MENDSCMDVLVMFPQAFKIYINKKIAIYSSVGLLVYFIYALLGPMTMSSVIWIGKAGLGKTPVMCILSMLWSTFHISSCQEEWERQQKPGF